MTQTFPPNTLLDKRVLKEHQRKILMGTTQSTRLSCTDQLLCFIKWISTSQILDKILQFHLPLCFDVGAVHIRVEEDYGKRQNKDGVRILELPNQGWIAHTVPLAENKRNLFKPYSYFLDNTQPKSTQEASKDKKWTP